MSQLWDAISSPITGTDVRWGSWLARSGTLIGCSMPKNLFGSF